VGFQVGHRGGIQPGVGVGLFQRPAVDGGVGALFKAARARRTHATQDRVDPVAVPHGVVQALEHQGHGTFAHSGSGGVPVEGAWVSQGPDRAGHAAHVAAEVDGSHQGHLQVAPLQGPQGRLQGAQARGLLGGDGIRGPTELELPGDPTGHDAAQGPHGAGRVQGRAGLVPQLGQPGRRLFGAQRELPGPFLDLVGQGPAQVEVGGPQVQSQSDQDPGLFAALPQGKSGILHGLGRDLQHQGLLGKKGRQVGGGDAETTYGDLDRLHPGPGAIWEVQTLLSVAPAVGRALRQGAGSLQHHLLELSQGGDAAEATSHADDRDRYPVALARHGLGAGSGNPGRSPVGIPFLYQQVGVDAAESEAAHGGSPQGVLRAPLPGFGMGRNPEGAAGQGDLGPRTSEIGLGSPLPVVQAEKDPDQPRGAGRGQQVADHRLHRTQGATTGSPAAFPETQQAGELHGVPCGGAGAVALHQLHFRRPPPRGPVGRAHGSQLPAGMGGQKVALDVVGQARSADHAVDPVFIPQSVFQSLQQDQTAALTDQQAVGRLIEGGATARGREGVQGREAHLRIQAIRS